MYKTNWYKVGFKGSRYIEDVLGKLKSWRVKLETNIDYGSSVIMSKMD